ncbi:acyl carrier protein [Kitasatospora sp. CM 4170]|uniref:Acyl carrier protein n=1 Tax=Kitasatospora aburaviensis TaxID=67265 RepID=A0ABW1EQV8_9ACTN|nr:acyl carrier protein [Kitasatospora sp. CM 4170]WNM44663.1 acyl carrier protein [Kitasatospora sp. CM 4170]
MTSRQEITDSVVLRLRQILPSLGEGGVVEDKDLRDYPEFDSLGILEVLVWLEGEFSVTIPDEELSVDNFNSIGKIVDYVVAHK